MLLILVELVFKRPSISEAVFLLPFWGISTAFQIVEGGFETLKETEKS